MANINESLTALLASDEPLAALSSLDDARKALDAIERQLIEAARAQNIGWAQIAAALGLRSRQAAEQRWLRLRGEDTRDPLPARRQRLVDRRDGLAGLRDAVLTALRHINADPDWDERHPRAILVRTSLSAAAAAPAGALYTLAKHAVDDLDDTPSLMELRAAVEAATPMT